MPTKKKRPVSACDDIDYGHGTIGDVERAMGGKAYFVVVYNIGKLSPKAIVSIHRQPYVNDAFRTRAEAERYVKKEKISAKSHYPNGKWLYKIMTGDGLRRIEKYGKYRLNFAIE